MGEQAGSRPELGRLIPGFKLCAVDGRCISPWDFKEQKCLMIVFFDPRSSGDLGALAAIKGRYSEIADANAEVLAVASGPFEELAECIAGMDFPFPLLSDQTGEARAAYGVTGSAIFATDRFGELRLMGTLAGDLDSLLGAVIGAVELAELECPECGVPTWPKE